jgi:hypothetical protein
MSDGRKLSVTAPKAEIKNRLLEALEEHERWQEEAEEDYQEELRRGREEPEPEPEPAAEPLWARRNRRNHPPGPGDADHNAAGLADFKAAFRERYHCSQEDVVDIALGLVAGIDLKNDPLWLLLVGPPSSGKTDLLVAVLGSPETHGISTFTEAALISGYRDPEDPERDCSLLPQIDGMSLIVKDMSCIHDLPSERRSVVLSGLRDAYDGFSAKKFGNSVATKRCHSRFNFLGGTTPDIEKLWSLNTLGERFLLYRMDITDRTERSEKALDNVLNEADREEPEMDREEAAAGMDAWRAALQKKARDYLGGLRHYVCAVGPAARTRIVELAEILTIVRTYVHHDRHGDIPYLPQAEMGPRAAKQLLRLGMSLAMVRGHEELGEPELATLKQVVLDSLPTNSRLLLEALHALGRKYANAADPKYAEDVAYFTGQIRRLSESTVRRELQSLTALKAVHRDWAQAGPRTQKYVYWLDPTMRGYCDRAGGVGR